MLSQISSEKIVSQLQELETQERKLEEDVMDRLTEILRRKYYLELGYPSLFEFAMKHLGYSAGKASRRISALKCLESLSDPKRDEVREKLKLGALTLTHLAQVQHVSRKEKIAPARKEEILGKLENTSAREAEKVLALEFGVAAVHRETERPITESESRVTLVLDQETLELIEKFKNLTAHQNPHGSMASVLKLALKVALAKKDPATKSVPAPEVAPPQTSQGPRLVTGRLRAQIWRRDRGRCSFVSSKTGLRCTSTYMLEVDHVQPYSLGGRTELGNLRLLCRAHHVYRLANGSTRLEYQGRSSAN